MHNFDEPSSQLRRLAETYGLRSPKQSRQFLGIHRGICVHFYEVLGLLHLTFFSPTANVTIAEHELEYFQSFEHLRQAGIPTDWVERWKYGINPGQMSGCILVLSQENIEQLSNEQFEAIPELIARDLHATGAATEIAGCSICGKPNPHELFYHGNEFRCACTSCLEELQRRYPDGVIVDETPVRWFRAAAALLIGFFIFSLAWAWLQEKETSAKYLLFVPFCGAIFFAQAIARFAEGNTLLLRLTTLAVTVGSVMLGNILALESAAENLGIPLSLRDAAQFYFTQQLTPESQEGWYLLGGLLGAWLGSRILRAQSRINFS